MQEERRPRKSCAPDFFIEKEENRMDIKDRISKILALAESPNEN